MSIRRNVIVACVVAFVVLGVWACDDDGGGDRHLNPQIGTAHIIWELVNSQVNPGIETAAECTPAGNVEVTYAGPTSGSANGPCSTMPLEIANLTAGSYTFDVVLTDETNHPGQSAATQAHADITAGGTRDIPVLIDCTFCPANPTVGIASIGWTLINSQINPGVDTPARCPPAGNVEVTFAGPQGGQASGPCSTIPLVIPNVVQGAYTWTVVLTDEVNHPGQSATAQVQADIVAGNTADIGVTIDCTFCEPQ